jgi:hypothetical protein
MKSELTRIAKLAGLNEAVDDNFELSDDDMDRMDAEELEAFRQKIPVFHQQLKDWMQGFLDAYPEFGQLDNAEYDTLLGPLAQRLEDYGYRLKTGNL